MHRALTRSERGDCTQQVVVDDGRGVVALAPARRRRGRRRDQKLFAGLGRRQVRLVDVLVAILDLSERRRQPVKAGELDGDGPSDLKKEKLLNSSGRTFSLRRLRSPVTALKHEEEDVAAAELHP